MIPVIVRSWSGLIRRKRYNEITERGADATLCMLYQGISVDTDCGRQRLSMKRSSQEAGVSVKEVNPSTMESKLVAGTCTLREKYLDLDALTGGFNLQIAWSTGYLAG